MERYEAVRTEEGRRVANRQHLEALPFRDLSGQRRKEWAVRAASFRSLLRRVVRPLERRRRRPLSIVDVGSGVGWLAHRLAGRGHDVAAIDLVTNDVDGLGVNRLFGRAVTSIQAEFDRLPLPDACVDLLVYNAAIHYSSDYATTLREALRVLRGGGEIAVMDSPIYADPASGAAMVAERDRAFHRRCPGAPLEAEGFLTYAGLAALGSELGLAWELVSPWYGIRWWLKPLVARLRRRREPADFKLIVGRRSPRG